MSDEICILCGKTCPCEHDQADEIKDLRKRNKALEEKLRLREAGAIQHAPALSKYVGGAVFWERECRIFDDIDECIEEIRDFGIDPVDEEICIAKPCSNWVDVRTIIENFELPDGCDEPFTCSEKEIDEFNEVMNKWIDVSVVKCYTNGMRIDVAGYIASSSDDLAEAMNDEQS